MVFILTCLIAVRVEVGNHDYPVIWFNTKEWLWGLGRNMAFEPPYGDYGFRVIVVIVGTGMLLQETFPGIPREGVALVWALQWEKMGWQVIRLSCSFYKQEGGSLKKWDELPSRSHYQPMVESNAVAFFLSTQGLPSIHPIVLKDAARRSFHLEHKSEVCVW